MRRKRKENVGIDPGRGQTLQPIERDVLRTLCGELRVRPGGRIVVAVSGGGDSMALLRILHRLDASGECPLELIVAHLDHGLRDESPGEAAFVGEAARSLGLPFRQTRVDIEAAARRDGMGVEEAARNARYNFFTRVAREERASLIATGHTADDQAETVLMRLIRGAGIEGLEAIPPRRRAVSLPPVDVIRPLLAQVRGALRDYLKAVGQSWRSDPTNRIPDRLRTRVRHELLPLLETNYNPAIRRQLVRTAATMADAADWLRTELDHLVRRFENRSGHVLADVQALAKLPRIHALGVLRRLLIEAGVSADRLGRDHLERVFALTDHAPEEKSVELPDGVRVCRQEDVLTLETPGAPSPPRRWRQRTVAVPGRTTSKPGGFAVTFEIVSADDIKGVRPDETNSHGEADDSVVTELFDADRLGEVVMVRPRRPGDRWRPLGAPGRRKLKDSLIDAGVPPEARERIVVVEDAKGRIAWASPLRIADHVKITDRTRRVCRARMVFE